MPPPKPLATTGTCLCDAISRFSREDFKIAGLASSVAKPHSPEWIGTALLRTAALKPHGPMETQLAERIAINAWRLRRAYRVESGLFERARSAWREGSTEQTSDIDLVFLRLSTSNGDELGKLSRYEAAIERSLR